MIKIVKKHTEKADTVILDEWGDIVPSKLYDDKTRRKYWLDVTQIYSIIMGDFHQHIGFIVSNASGIDKSKASSWIMIQSNWTVDKKNRSSEEFSYISVCGIRITLTKAQIMKNHEECYKDMEART